MVLLKVAEAFAPKKEGGEEMPLSVGEQVYIFETSPERSWVFGYVASADGRDVLKEGWCPRDFLVPLDVDISAAADGAAVAGGEQEERAVAPKGSGRGRAGRSGRHSGFERQPLGRGKGGGRSGS